jgi:hypothetical protein
VLGMVDVIGAALGTVGWMLGALLLVTMAVLPLLELVATRTDHRSPALRSTSSMEN